MGKKQRAAFPQITFQEWILLGFGQKRNLCEIWKLKENQRPLFLEGCPGQTLWWTEVGLSLSLCPLFHVQHVSATVAPACQQHFLAHHQALSWGLQKPQMKYRWNSHFHWSLRELSLSSPLHQPDQLLRFSCNLYNLFTHAMAAGGK